MSSTYYTGVESHVPLSLEKNASFLELLITKEERTVYRNEASHDGKSCSYILLLLSYLNRRSYHGLNVLFG